MSSTNALCAKEYNRQPLLRTRVYLCFDEIKTAYLERGLLRCNEVAAEQMNQAKIRSLFMGIILLIH